MAASFNPLLYNTLPSLDEAVSQRQQPHINALISGPIRSVFLKHGAQADFCLYLQHRHHNVQYGQAIVKVNGTANLMDESHMQVLRAMGNKIVPATWMGNGGIEAMEFAILPEGSPNVLPNEDFVRELSEVLAENGCSSLFGLDTKAENNWSELTIGNSSVVVPSSDADVENYHPVAFAFEEGKPDFVVHGKCGKDHKHTSKPD